MDSFKNWDLIEKKNLLLNQSSNMSKAQTGTEKYPSLKTK